MKFLNRVKNKYNEVKEGTKNILRTIKDIFIIVKSSIKIISKMKKKYNYSMEKAYVNNNNRNYNYSDYDQSRIIDVDYREV